MKYKFWKAIPGIIQPELHGRELFGWNPEGYGLVKIDENLQRYESNLGHFINKIVVEDNFVTLCTYDLKLYQLNRNDLSIHREIGSIPDGLVVRVYRGDFVVGYYKNEMHEGHYVCYNVAIGKEVWRQAAIIRSHTTMLLEGNLCIVQNHEQFQTICFDLQTGHIKWEHRDRESDERPDKENHHYAYSIFSVAGRIFTPYFRPEYNKGR